jgi:hypothetical protein
MLPQIVYLQTITECNGHCRYCPFDDVYGDQDPIEMSIENYETVLNWLKENNYKGRIGFLLHYEPTMDDRLEEFVNVARETLPNVSLEAASNGIKDIPNIFDHVDIVPANSRIIATSRAGNVRQCPEIEGRGFLRPSPCPIPLETMCIAANGDVLLCCQDWRHEAVVGNISNLTKAREKQLGFMSKVRNVQLEICQDCMSGKTAEEIGERLGKRTLTGRKKNEKKTIRDNENGMDNSSVDGNIGHESE